MNPGGLLARIGVEHPVFLAPLAGGPSTPELAAAVCNAGGLGAIGAAYLTPEQIAQAVDRTRALTSLPFAVNLFAGGWEAEPAPNQARMLAVLGEVHRELGLPPPEPRQAGPDPFPSQFEAVLAARPAVFSFTFGVPDSSRLARARAAGMATVGTATTAEEGRILAGAGVDAVVAQGEEAGGHRGTFAGPFEAALVPTLELVRAVRAAVSVPVIASGGLMDGRDVAAALAAGAEAAQLGTAFLPCPESGASPAYKRALLEARRDTTVVTRAFSGRPARGLSNAFVERLGACEDAILPYPIQNALTRPMRSEAAKRGRAGYLSLWAGRGVARARAMPAGELVRALVEEMSGHLA